MLRELLHAILNIMFGHRTVDSAKDWHAAHEKADASRREIDQIIAHSNDKQAR
jgi:hypothetical protein